MSQTLKNLAKAFVGESQARNRYTFYAKVAKKEAYEKINEIFLLTADNEKEHAKWLMRMINQLTKNSGETITIPEAPVPTVLGDTVANLKSAIAGETYETETMYPGFADVAEQEGYSDIAKRLRAIAKAEAHHKQRYEKILKEVENNSFFKKEEKVYWVCRECGYIHEGIEPPEVCPSCGHPKAYFELQNEEY